MSYVCSSRYGHGCELVLENASSEGLGGNDPPKRSGHTPYHPLLSIRCAEHFLGYVHKTSVQADCNSMTYIFK